MGKVNRKVNALFCDGVTDTDKSGSRINNCTIMNKLGAIKF